MPLCRYRDGAEARLGWFAPGDERVAPLPGMLADLLALDSDERRARTAASHGAKRLALRDLELLAPVDAQEIWAAGVTYARSREARMEESTQEDVYDRVYRAERPELFFKTPGARCVGPDGIVAIRDDSTWDVPEPELAIVLDAGGRVAGYSIGNDVSSRSIEGENPLYLPQAKVYADSCALGPWIMLPDELSNPDALDIRLAIERAGEVVFTGSASTSQMRRGPAEQARWLFRALEFPTGVVLLTGTGIVPPATFTLAPGDITRIEIDGIGALTNRVRRLPGPA